RRCTPCRRGAACRARGRARARLRAGGRCRGGGVRRVTASAPGKLFVTGEYAVLAGAPALLAAVDRRALVHIALEPGAGALEAESLAEGTRRVIHDPEREPLGGGDAGAVLAALRIVRAAMPSLAAMRAQVVVDTRTFLADGEKLGPGRSAATVTAAVASAPRSLHELSAAAGRAAAAVERGDGAALLDAVASTADLLARLGDEVGIPIVTPALARLVAAARRVGAAAKPSGAGGGDCG